MIHKIQIVCAVILISLMLMIEIPAASQGIDSTILKQLNLGASPLDIEISEDGKLMFVLVPGKVLVYSDFGNQPVNTIPIDKNFDRLALAEKIDILILSSSSDRQIRLVQIDMINEISIEGSPFRGPADASVTIAVFDDYQ